MQWTAAIRTVRNERKRRADEQPPCRRYTIAPSYARLKTLPYSPLGRCTDLLRIKQKCPLKARVPIVRPCTVLYLSVMKMFLFNQTQHIIDINSM